MSSKQTVFVIDDEEAVRDSLQLMLERRGYDVQAFASGEDFLNSLQSEVSGCIVCDIRLSGLSGLDLQRKLPEMDCSLPLIFMTGHGDIEMAVAALKKGASDFIEKPFTDVRIYNAVAAALAAGQQRRAKEESRAVLEARIADLSDRQRQVMEYLIDGHTNKEIGRRLGISPRTIETYRAFVMAKMGAASLADLVKMAIRMGLRT